MTKHADIRRYAPGRSFVFNAIIKILSDKTTIALAVSDGFCGNAFQYITLTPVFRAVANARRNGSPRSKVRLG